MLSKCKTVKEAVDFLKDYNISSGFNDYLLFADVSGDSIVIEWIDDKMKIIVKEEDKNYQIATNFWLTNTELGGYPCERYIKVENLLSQNEPTQKLCVQALEENKQDWEEGDTLYSNVYNLTDRTVNVYLRGNMTDCYVLNSKKIFDMMEKGEELSEKLDGQKLKSDH